MDEMTDLERARYNVVRHGHDLLKAVEWVTAISLGPRPEGSITDVALDDQIAGAVDTFFWALRQLRSAK